MPSRTHLPEPLAAQAGTEPGTDAGTDAGTAPEASIGLVLALRLATVPDGAPPYDCETHGAGCRAVLDTVRTRPDVDPRATLPALALAIPTTPAPAPTASGASESAVPVASPVAAGATAAWPRQFAQVVVEILAGSRPTRQIFPWTTDRARAQLRRLGPLLRCDRRPKIQRVMTSRPTALVVEMTVVVDFGVRTHALAMRFEHVAGRQAAPGLPARPARWLCTEIEAG